MFGDESRAWISQGAMSLTLEAKLYYTCSLLGMDI